MTDLREKSHELMEQAIAKQRREALAAIPAKWAQPPANLIATLPAGGAQLEYLGHAETTLALIEIDPHFSYGWLTNPDGTMLITERGKRLVLEGWLMLVGERRDGVGTCKADAREPEKELIGDLLRNCAMRFGVATALWSKAERHDTPQASRSAPAPEPTGLTEAQAKRIVLGEVAGNKSLALTIWERKLAGRMVWTQDDVIAAVDEYQAEEAAAS